MIEIEPIGVVKNNRIGSEDDNWGDLVSEIILNENFLESSLDGIDNFSHLEIVYYFHLVDKSEICYDTRVPRNNPEWPKLGIFAQRSKHHPNQLGLTIVKLIRRDGRLLTVKYLDAVNGTPVIDIKPVMVELLPSENIKQPTWSSDLMKDYWKNNQ